ncbi:alpha/beta hydrolase [Streptomyces anulatus]
MRTGDRGPVERPRGAERARPRAPEAGARAPRRAGGRSVGQRATLVTADQGGHSVYPFGGNTYAKGAVTAFLTTGQQSARDLDRPVGPGGQEKRKGVHTAWKRVRLEGARSRRERFGDLSRSALRPTTANHESEGLPCPMLPLPTPCTRSRRPPIRRSA